MLIMLAVASSFVFAHQTVSAEDAGGREELLVRMTEYLNAMDTLSISEAEAEVDFMISSIEDSLFRNTAATAAYRHFRASKHMGSENIAIHIYDRWFAPFRTVFEDVDELDEAELYAFINRRSLIGCKARPLELIDLNSGTVVMPPPDGRKSIIFFYSVGCPKCLYVSMTMSEYLNVANPEVNLFTVYTGQDDAAWQLYVEREINVTAPRVKVFHLGVGDSTEFTTAYGVIQTPRLFLVDEDGSIIGRNLDTKALSALLD